MKAGKRAGRPSSVRGSDDDDVFQGIAKVNGPGRSDLEGTYTADKVDPPQEEVAAAWGEEATGDAPPAGPAVRRYIITAENCSVQQAANEISKVSLGEEDLISTLIGHHVIHAVAWYGDGADHSTAQTTSLSRS